MFCVCALQCSLLPLDQRVDAKIVAAVGDVLSELNISFIVDDSNNSIGRRYARTDEIGIPFAITVEQSTGVTYVSLRKSSQYSLSHFRGSTAVTVSSRFCLSDMASVLLVYSPPVCTSGVVTIRDRDSCGQVRVPTADLASLVAGLCAQKLVFADLLAKYEVVTTGEDKAGAAGAGAGSAAGAGSSTGAKAPATAALVVEGLDRVSGRFSRPKESIL